MQMSANGTADGCPAAASWNAPSMSSRLSASTIVPPCTSGSKSGWLAKDGSRSRTRLILTVPLRDCHRLISATNSPGSAPGSIISRNATRGWTVVTTVAAVSRRPSVSSAPVTRPPPAVIRVTGDPVQISAPNDRAAAAIAPLTAPMPPRGNPQAPACPAASPMWWCRVTYPVPGDRGPAHMPITPETDSTPRSASLSKYWSSRSAMLPLNSRVRSTASLVSMPRSRPSSAAWPSTSRGRREPSLGGIRPRSGPRTAE